MFKRAKVNNKKLKGYVDKIDSDFVYGWAAYLNSEKPLSLFLECNGEKIGFGIADIYRDDLLKNNINKGFHGFKIKIGKNSLEGCSNLKLIDADDVRNFLNISLDFNIESSYKCNIEHVAEGKVVGWVLDLNSLNQPQKILIKCDGLIVAKGVANIYRDDIKNIFGSDVGVFSLYFDETKIEKLILDGGLDLKLSLYVVKDDKEYKINENEYYLKNLMVYEQSSMFFDEDFYNQKYPGCWGWEHYCVYGQYEKKYPHKDITPEVLDRDFRSGNRMPLLEMEKFSKNIDAFKISENPDLSIIILNWNKSVMTLQCVYAIFKNTHSKNVEIIIVDNGSRDEEFSKLLSLRSCSSIKIIKNKTNRFYGEANNIGVEAASSDVICLLNNDAFVAKNWDKHLLAELNSNPSIGGVGPKFLFPDGRLQEAGGTLSPCGQNVQVGKFLDPSLSFFNKNCDVTHISAACFMLNKDLYYRVNGFDYRYEPAYYEDADLTAKIATLGFRIRYVANSTVIHVENATSKDLNIGFNFGSLIATNRLKFVEKWGAYLRGGTAPAIPDFSLEYKEIKITDINKKKAVIYSPYNLVPGGGERYVLSLAIAANVCGYDTYFCTPERYSKFRFYTVASELGLDVKGINLIGEDDLRKLGDISLFIAMSNELSPFIQAMGSDKNIYHCQFPFPMSDWHKANCLENVTDYDLVIVNSEFTKNSYIKEASKYSLKIPPVKVISPPVELIDQEKKNNKKIKILNVGRYIAGGHCKKQVELVTAFNTLYEKLKVLHIEASFTLIGSLGASEEDRSYLQRVQEVAGPGVEIVLNASREFIVKKYQESDFYWHGTGIGESVIETPERFEHFGITPIEAVSAGCVPVVWYQGGPGEIIDSIKTENVNYLAENVTDYHEITLRFINDSHSHGFNFECFDEAYFLESISDLILNE